MGSSRRGASARSPSARSSRSRGRSSRSGGPGSRSSTTCENCEAIMWEQSTLWPGASRAKTCRSPAEAPASRAPARACGPRCFGSCANCDPLGSSLRTFLLSAFEARTRSSLTWKIRATPSGRPWWALGRSGRRTGATGSGFWPTATATRYGSGNNGNPGDGRTEYATKRAPSLETCAKLDWSTASARDWKDTAGMSPIRPDGKGHRLDQLPRQVFAEESGRPGAASLSTSGRPPASLILNWRWVAQLMGFPRGWCDVGTAQVLRLSETAWSPRSSRRSARRS